MTRTERSFTPRAIIKDRSESKTGLDKSDRKGGAGAHNWGSYAHEQEHEFGAVEDYEEEEEEDLKAELSSSSVSDDPKSPVHSGGGVGERRASITVSEEERQRARQFRATALKDSSADLGAIARTSAAVSAFPLEKPSSPVTVSTDADTATSVVP